jgi:hypothetical protein
MGLDMQQSNLSSKLFGNLSHSYEYLLVLEFNFCGPKGLHKDLTFIFSQTNL